jgi:hypothetical protein
LLTVGGVPDPIFNVALNVAEFRVSEVFSHAVVDSWGREQLVRQ